MRKKENRQCSYCKYYDAYYKQCSNTYQKLTHGICRKTCTPTPQFDTCDLWQDNHSQRQTLKELNFAKLKKIADSLNEIAQIMKEEQEINKLDPL